MIYELHFHPLALKEWKKLSKDLQEQFKKLLSPDVKEMESQTDKVKSPKSTSPHVKLSLLSNTGSSNNNATSVELATSATIENKRSLGP